MCVCVCIYITLTVPTAVCQMSASEMVSALPSAEKVVAVMISRSAALFRLPDAVLRDVDRQWALLERAEGTPRPLRRVERRCAMKRTRAKVSSHR